MIVRTSALLLMFGCGIVCADDPKSEVIDPSGKPKDYKAGQSSCYAIWNDADGWHFRYTTVSDDVVTFVASIEVVSGRFSTITPRGTPTKGVDQSPKKSTAPKYTFNSKINRGIEGGIDFTLDDKATALKFDLKINGKDVPRQVYIGEKGTHPKESPFQLPSK
jgi:hypothetical protein